jgi:hypothetical protein
MSAVSATPFALSDVSHTAVIEFFKQAYELLNTNYSMRKRFEQIDRTYQRELDATQEHQRAKQANRNYDPTKFQNIQVPIVMPQVESATAYQTGVFLTGYPIFGVVASPQFMDEAMQLEAVIANQQIRGGWIAEFIKFFRDGAKYNLHALECSWDSITVPTLEAGVSVGSVNAKQTLWAGNSVKRRDLYNCFWDSRYQPVDVATRGDFIGYTDLMSRVELKRYINSLQYKQTGRLASAFESSTDNTYYIPSINSDTWATEGDRKKFGGMNWLAWAGLESSYRPKIDYKELYEVSHLYARIIPVEFGMRVPQLRTPQIWKFCIVNSKHVVYAERQTNIHDNLPILLGQPYDDGLGYQTKSLAENVEPFQHLSSALVNANMASRRRAISDRILFDPSRIAAKDINSDNPAARIPVRPAAFGKDIKEAVFPFPYREDQAANNMQDLAAVMRFSDMVGGQNPVRQGQFVKGNKTKQEFQDVMGNATARDQMVAMHIESQTMTPLKEMLKSNILQYQGAASLQLQGKKKIVQIDPVALRKAVLEFKMSDGLVPSDKLISGDEWIAALQFFSSSPQVAAGYNMAPMVSYLMKVRGADLREFEKSPEQMAYEQAMMAWQQAVVEIAKINEKAEQKQPYPPQPVPQQFGYTPGEQNGQTSSN